MALIKTDFLKCVKNEPQGLVDVNFHDLVSDTDNRNEFAGWVKTVKAEDISITLTPDQGITRDANYWIEFNTGSIKKYDLSGNLVAENTNPFTGITPTMTHLGDGELYNGVIYVGMSDWASGSASNFALAKYNLSDLSLISYANINTQKTTAGVCLSKDKTEIYAVSYNSGSQDRIERFNANTLASLGHIQLSQSINKMQGIVVAPDGYIHVTTYDNPDNITDNHSFIRTIYPDGTVMPQQYRGWGMALGEIEGICIWDGVLYTHEYQSQVKKFVRYQTLDDSFFDNLTASMQTIKMIDSVEEQGTILIRTKPHSFYNFNNIFNTPMDSVSYWGAWFNSAGTLHFRVDSATRIEVPNVTLDEHILAFTWNKKADGTVDIQVGVDGSFIGSMNQPWRPSPAGGFYFHSKNTTNEVNGKSWDRGYAVLNKVISAQEFTDVNSDFDAMYDLFNTSSQKIKIGNSNVDSIKIGNSNVDKIMVGTNQLWP